MQIKTSSLLIPQKNSYSLVLVEPTFSKEKEEHTVLKSALTPQELQSLQREYTQQQERQEERSSSIALASVERTAYVLTLSSKKGQDGEERINTLRKWGSSAFHHFKRIPDLPSFVVFFSSLSEREYEAFLEGFVLGSYRFDHFLSKKKSSAELSDVTLVSTPTIGKESIARVSILCRAVFTARDLINTPPNICNPTFLVSHAKNISKELKLDIDVLNERKLRSMGADIFCSVMQGSEEPGYLIKLSYTPKKKNPKTPILALVGKGVTFDSGGLSIKPSQSMEAMKSDMSGAACVLAAIQAIAQLKLPIEVRGYIPTAENMINGRASRPGDVVRGINRKSVEIMNTDAEGRLLLSDTLTLAEREGAEIIVDIATLTGAIRIALGNNCAGLFANNDELADRLLQISRETGEKFWRLPLLAEYKEQLSSPIADMRNVGGKFGGSIIAALFLQEFIEKAKWLHLDIAATAFSEKEQGYIPKGGVGFGVRTLVKFVESFV